jgi:hypothetical protein
MKIDRGIVFGKKAKYTYWGRRGCSVGMYSTGGYYFYVYGIKGLFNFIVDKRWGDMITPERRF